MARLAADPSFVQVISQMGGLITHDCIIMRAYNYKLFEESDTEENVEMDE